MPLRLLLLLAGLLAVFPAQAHEGHDHGAPPPPVSATIAPRAEASSPVFELVAVARGARLFVYLDGFRDNAPVKGARIEIDAAGETRAATEEADGVYVLDAPWAARPGAHDLALTVTADGEIDVLTATLTVPSPAPPPPRDGWGEAISRHGRAALANATPWNGAAALIGLGGFLAGLLAAGLWRRRVATALALLVAAGFVGDRAQAAETAVAPVARDVAQRFPDGSVFAPKQTQRILAIRTELAETKSYAGTVELPGRVIPDPGGAGYVQASVAGRLMPPPGGFPRLGTPVKAGETLAHVHPAVGAADVTSQQQQARDLDQQIALVGRRLERMKAISAVVARAQIEDAELELAGLRARRGNLDRAPRHVEDLVAPVSGVVAAVAAVAGQIAEPNAIIFQIVDPARFWVEALSYDAQPLSGAATARFADGRAYALVFRGMGLAARNQAIPVQFGFAEEAKGLRAGQLLTVLAATSEQRSGVAAPRAAVLRGANGQSLVFEHVGAERFAPREVRVAPLDGARVLIVSGLESGKRIVTQGAELLNQIR